MPRTQRLKNLFFVFIALTVVVGILGLVYPSASPKIAYVNVQKLLFDYIGMREAQTDFDLKKQKMRSNVDTLQAKLEQRAEAFRKQQRSMSPEQRQVVAQQLQQQERHYLEYAKGIAQKIEEEDAAMMRAVLNQVNSFVEQYAEQQGYDLILGTDGTGNVLYGKKNLDITEALTKAINQEYQGR